MSREIKFKFWLGHTKKMTYEHSLIEISHAAWDFTEDIIALEFTGLQDKNQNDVFDGDICKALFRTRNEVLEIQGRIMMDDYMWCIHCGDEIYSINRIHDVEIIGNIYENPTL